MLGDIKRRLVATRAQGALAVADLAVEQGDAGRAIALYREQARDLAARGVDKELEVRGWFGILRASVPLLRRGEVPADALREALAALAGMDRGRIPPAWLRYDDYRELGVLLLERAPARAVELARYLCGLVSVDPRPHYLLGRALEADLEGQRASARGAQVEQALTAYREALADAIEVGGIRRWEPVVHLRMAALLWRWRRLDDPEAARHALELVEKLDRAAVQEAAPPYRLVVAQIWLGSDRAMTRLRALDMLEAMVGDPALRGGALRVLDEYLERLGWTYYPTEHDRVRAIFGRIAPGLGPEVARRGLAWLELLGRLHDSEGRRAPPSRSHLQTLHAIEAGRGQVVSAAYYAVALRLAERPEGADFAEVLVSALDEHAEAVRQVWTRLLVEPLALGLGALCQWRRVDKVEVRQLLRAYAHGPWAVAHVQESFGLLLPPLILHADELAELADPIREAVERYLRLAPAPSFGFSSVGAAMLAAGEPNLAAMAARRAMIDRSREPSEALNTLVHGLAVRAMRSGEVTEAAAWLLGMQGR